MLELRADLLRSYPWPLPEWCHLPKHYPLLVETDRTHCDPCARRLRRQRISKRFPISLLLGCPELRHRHKQCPSCGTVYPCEKLARLVPPHGNYAFDVITEIGLARFHRHKQAQEIQEHLLCRFGLYAPETTVHHLADRFVLAFAAVHQAYAPQLKEWFLQQHGGYVLHLDGTCEAGTRVIFIAVDGQNSLTLFTWKIPSENVEDIKAFIRQCVRLFGNPLATVRDLSDKIRIARDDTLEGVPDFVCLYHLLGNIGERLCKKHRKTLSDLLRDHALRSSLSALRAQIHSQSKDEPPISPQAYEALLRDPTKQIDAPPVQRRRLLTLTLIRWVEDSTAELSGEYFPFDQPELVFYKRCREMLEWLDELLKSCVLDAHTRAMFTSLRNTLAPTREDPQLVDAARRLEKAFKRFEELRETLRLQTPQDRSLLRQHPPQQLTIEQARAAEQRLKDYRKGLDPIISDASDPEHSEDAKIVAAQLDKYWDRLFGRVIIPPGRNTPVVVKRTNNPPEHKFGARKRGWRRQSGNESLKRRLDAANDAEFLVDNLDNQEYVNIVYGGSLDNIASRLAEHWPEITETNAQDDEDKKAPNRGDQRRRRLHVPKGVVRSPDFFSMMRCYLLSLHEQL